MITLIRQLFRPRQAGQSPAIPAGERVYAIGDIHGRLDLLISLADAIEADDKARGPANTTVVLLGDLVDRGPSSSGVLAFLQTWGKFRPLRILTGNHEEVFLESFDCDDAMRQFLRIGGWETLLSYGIDQPALTAATLSEARELMRAAVPEEDLDYIRGFQDFLVIGDYLFVHAGIRPGVALEEQTPVELRWIRKPFINSRDDHGHIVVHGHTITETPDIRPNRIGIDTGAYMSGQLTALGLEGSQRWLIETAGNDATEEQQA